jgi:hypothetical protein
MIWKAVVWSIWPRRNSVMFDNGRIDIAEVLEEITVLSWKWWLNEPKVAPSLLYEWRAQPVLCMVR